jgi:cystathionine beta-lyase
MRTDDRGRRSFLRNVGLTALSGAAAARAKAAAFGEAAAVAADGRFDFDTVYARIGSDCTKYDKQLRTFGNDSVEVGMGIADMDFRAAPCITQALRRRLEHENWGYLDMDGVLPQLAEQVAGWNRRRYGVTIDPASLVFTTGVHPALIAAIQAFGPRGSKVLLATPTYDGFYSDLAFAGTPAVESPLRLENGRYAFDYDDFERRIAHDTHTFILCNPQNPTGNCWSAEQLTRIGEICFRRRVVVLADEIHCDFVAKGQRYTPFASLPDKRIVDNSLTFKAASKSFNLSAHKLGWFYSTNPELLARVRPYVRADITTLAVVANRAAYAEGEEWLAQAAAYIEANRDFAVSYIGGRIPGITAAKPQGTFLCWLDARELMERIGAARSADEYNRTKPANQPARTPEQMLQQYLVTHAKVHLNPGSAYGKGGDGHMRMNIATSRRLLELALRNIATAVRNV